MTETKDIELVATNVRKNSEEIVEEINEVNSDKQHLLKSEDVCGICLEPGNKLKRLKHEKIQGCTFKVHRKCIDDYYKNNDNDCFLCPGCRDKIIIEQKYTGISNVLIDFVMFLIKTIFNALVHKCIVFNSIIVCVLFVLYPILMEIYGYKLLGIKFPEKGKALSCIILIKVMVITPIYILTLVLIFGVMSDEKSSYTSRLPGLCMLLEKTSVFTIYYFTRGYVHNTALFFNLFSGMWPFPEFLIGIVAIIFMLIGAFFVDIYEKTYLKARKQNIQNRPVLV